MDGARGLLNVSTPHRLRWHLYGPPGGTASAVLSIDGHPQRGHVVRDGDRQVVSTLLQFAPGSTHTVSWSVTLPRRGDVVFEHTPGMLPVPARVTVAGCGPS